MQYGGTSSGSIISALYAMGYSPYYIYILFKRYAKELVDQNAILSIKNVKQIMGIYSGEKMEIGFNKVAERKGIKQITDIEMPISIPAVDVQDKKEYIFTNMIKEKETEKEKQENKESYYENKKNEDNRYITDISIGKAIRASSSFPIAFNPCEYKEHEFLDGGILNNIPAIEVRKLGVDKVISVNFEADKIDNNSNIIDIAMRSIDIMGNKTSDENLNDSDIVLTIRTDKTGLLELEKLDDCYYYGYSQTLDKIDEIKNMINK